MQHSRDEVKKECKNQITNGKLTSERKVSDDTALCFINSWRQLAGYLLIVFHSGQEPTNRGKGNGGGRFNNYKFQQTAAVAGGAEGTRQEGTGLVVLLTENISFPI